MTDKKKVIEYFDSLAEVQPGLGRRKRYFWSLVDGWFRHMVSPGKRILELGCSDGRLLEGLQASRAVGVDFSEAQIRHARERRPGGEWILGDVTESLPELKGPFDYIIGMDLVGYLSDIHEPLIRIKSLCHERTRVILTKNNPFWEPVFRLASWLGLAAPRRYVNWLTLNQLEHIVSLAGYEVIRSGKFCLLPVYIPLVSELCNRILAHLPVLRRLNLVEYLVMRPVPVAHESKTPPSVSIVIPARNEKGNVRAALERIPSFRGAACEVIFVEGHSTDETWKVIQEESKKSWPFQVRICQQTGKGKGDAVRLGFGMAQNDILMILDADLTVMPEELTRAYDLLADRWAEYVHGTRLVYPMEREAMRPLNWIGNRVFGFLLSFLLEQTLTDTLCGTKCLWKKDYEDIARNRVRLGDFDPFGDFDLIFGSAMCSLKMAEFPVHYKSRTYGETNIRRFRDGLLLFRMTWFAARKLYFI